MIVRSFTDTRSSGSLSPSELGEMTQKKVETQTGRKRYSAEFEQQALLRTVQDTVPMAARNLGLEAAQLAARQSRAGQQGRMPTPSD